MRAAPIVLLGVAWLLACEPTRQAATSTSPPRIEASDSGVSAPEPAPTTTIASLPDAAPAPVERRLIVRLLPLGGVQDETLRIAKDGLMAHGPIRAVVEKRLPLPKTTESSQKGRYRSELILEWMARLDLPAGGKVLGITDVDIVAKKGDAPNWGVLGLGAIDGRMCVISTFRMKKKKGGGTVTDDVVTERLWKTAIHEVGHTIGIEHCPSRGCLMQDARGTVFTTDEEHDFCPACAAAFARAAAAQEPPGVSER
jgi:archaemetzincin